MKSTFEQLNWLIRGWINYYRIGSMKIFLEEYGQWLRHKVRVVILKQWKKSRRIYLNLQKLKQIIGCEFTHEEIFKVANSRLGWYRRSGMYVVNFAISPEILGRKTKSRPGLVDPLQYYLSNIWFYIDVAPYTRTVRTVQWEGEKKNSHSTLFAACVKLTWSVVHFGGYRWVLHNISFEIPILPKTNSPRLGFPAVPFAD